MQRPVRLADVDATFAKVEDDIRRRLKAAGRDASEAGAIAQGRHRAHRQHAERGERFDKCEWCRLIGSPPVGYRTTSTAARVDPLPDDDDRDWWVE